MNLILNRDFKMPDDGWYQLAPLGEFPHAAAGVVQVVDGEACLAMAARFAADAAIPNFAGLLVDFDHFSLDGERRTEAAGWIVGLEYRGQTADHRPQTADQEGDPHPNPSTGLRAGPLPSSSFVPQCGTTADRQGEGVLNSPGLWGKIRWSDVGEEAVKGGRYRFLSPVWARSDCVNLGPDPHSGRERVRPVRLLNAAVTNDPNLKGLCPLSNSGRDHGPQTTDHRLSGDPVDRRASIGGCAEEAAFARSTGATARRSAEGGSERMTMKRVIETLTNHLGIPGDASVDVILEKMQGLPAITAVAELQNSLKQVTDERDALRGELKGAEDELVNRDLAEFEGVVTEKTKTFWTEQLMTNRTAALAALTEFATQCAVGEKKAGQGGDTATGPGPARKPLHNRATARPVIPSVNGTTENPSTGSGLAAARIRNRAHEIAGAEKIPFIVAFRRAENEAAA